MDFKSIKARDKEYIANSYNRQDVWFKKGRGARLYDCLLYTSRCV